MLGRKQVAYLVKKKKTRGVELFGSPKTVGPKRFDGSTVGLSGSASVQLIANPKGRIEPERSPIDSPTGLTNRSSLVCETLVITEVINAPHY